MTSNTADNQSPTRTGQCLCGAIKYSLTGASAKPYYNTICHCLNCRRVTGSAFLLASITPRSGFVITSGASSQRTYQDTSTSSGTALTRVACGICSSNLFAFTPLWDEIVSIAAGTLDDFDEKWEPDTEQWCMHRVGWLGEKDWGVDGGRKFEGAVKKA